MSSAKLRMTIGPALNRLRQHVATAENALDHDEALDDATLDSLRQERQRIVRILTRLEADLNEWNGIMHGLQGAEREDEEAIFAGFVRDDRHFTEWMEDARETLANIDEEFEAVDHAHVAGGGQLQAAAVLPPPAANGQPPFAGQLPAAAVLPPPAANGQPPFAGQLPAAAVLPPPAANGQPPFAVANGQWQQPAPPPLAARLPQLSLPSFDGDPLDWPAFWQSFESAVDRLPLEPVDKLNYLHGCLRGKASRAVTAYRGGENYVHAVAALRRLFGDPWKIAEALQAELMNLRPVDDNVGSLQHFLETLERVCRQLLNLEMPDDSPFMYQVIRSKLPSTVLSELVKMERTAGVKWGTTQLRTGLAEVISIREEVQRCLRDATTERPPRSQQDGRLHHPQRHDRSGQARVFAVSQSTKNEPGRVPSCLFCSDKHWIADCCKVTDLESRKRSLMQQNRCFNCLRKGHRLSDCRSQRGCRVCKERHHVAICPSAKRSPFPSTEESRNALPSSQSRAMESNPTHVVSSAVVSQTTPSSQLNNSASPIMAIISPSLPHLVMLMAVRAPVFSESAPSRRKEALIFFDPGAQVTMVKTALVRHLSPPKLQEDHLELNPFHARQPIKMNAPQYALCIQREDGSHETLVAHRTDWIVPSVRRATFPQGMLVPVDEEPDILIGMADFWKFFHGVQRVSPEFI